MSAAFLPTAGSNNIFPSIMETRHIDFSFEDLKAEQDSIDKIIDTLLNSNPPFSSGSLLQQRRESGVSTSASPVRGRGTRGPGRPKGTRTTTTRTPSSPTAETPETLSLLAVIQCLNKINVQNKRLLEFVEVISNKVENTNTPNAETNVAPIVSDGNSTTSQSLAVVSDRLEKIEQNINSTTLICRGSVVEDLLKDSLTGESPNLERLKGEICRNACGDEVTSIDITNVQSGSNVRRQRDLNSRDGADYRQIRGERRIVIHGPWKGRLAWLKRVGGARLWH